MTVIPDPRPDARVVADRDAWASIITEKMGPCRVSGEMRDIDYAHLVSRAQRGDDVSANIIPLRHDLHMHYHSHDAMWEEIAHAIRHSLTPVELAYVVAKKGRAWLDRMYPTGGEFLCARCKRPVRSQEPSSAPRKRKRYVVTVPDDCEDGADVLDGLVQAHRERLAPSLGWSADVGGYYVLAAVLAEAL